MAQEPNTNPNETDFMKVLLGVQKELSSKKLVNDGKNPHYHSEYVTLPALLEFVLPVLNKHGVVLTQMPTIIDGQPALTTQLSMDKDNGIHTTMLLMLKSEDPQAQGSAITYARRFALAAMLGIQGDEDDDGQAATNSARSTSTEKSVSPANAGQSASEAQIKLMLSTIKRKGFDDETAVQVLCNWAEVGNPNEITKGEASGLIEKLFKVSKEELQGFVS